MSSVSRPVRRLATILTSIGLAGLLATSSVLAGTPVSVGWRDHAYGNGATRPSSDKPQSKLWFTDESGDGSVVQWWGGMFHTTGTAFKIFKLSPDKSTWTATSAVADARDGSHGDYLWDESSKTLYVASVVNPNNSVPFALPGVSDNVRIFKFTYNPATDAWTPKFGAGVGIPGTSSTASPEFRGGAWTVSIEKDSTDRLWAVWPQGTQVMYSTSTDDGVTWSAAAALPAQGTNTIKSGTISSSDTATVIGFGNGSKTTIGVAWSDQDGSETAPGVNGNGYWFATIAAGDDPTLPGSWTTAKLPAPAGLGTIYADNHINIKATSDGTLYMVGKARTDTINCATLKDRLLTPFYRRTTAGTWTVRLAGTVGDCDTRPQVVISEELDTAYIFVTSPNGGGAIYRKAAPLTGPNAFDFRGDADTLVKRGVTFIRSATETLIDDASTTKQVVTADSGIAVIANNLSSSAGGNAKVYLHNYMTLPSVDGTAPTGTVAINGGAANTDTSAVTMSVAATDNNPGSGIALVRLSNSGTVDADNRLDGAGSTSYTYTPSIAWTMTSGLGTRTVYAQWRDAAGNWSTPVSDTINVTNDSTPPNPPASVTYSLGGSGGFTIPVKLAWPAATDNPTGPVAGYRIARSVNGGAFTNVVANQPGLTLYMGLSNTSATYRFCVYAIDGVGLESAPRCTPTFRATSYSESNAAMKFSGSWALSNSTVYIGGKAKISSTRNASVTLNFTGNRVGWYAKTGPTLGQARVYINGALVSTVNLYSATDQTRRLVFSRSFGSIATRSIKIVVVGTAGHPKVVVDQIFVLR